MDPRIARLVEKYAYARGDSFLRRGKGGPVPGDVLAGWALDRAQHDPIRAIEVLRGYPLPPDQRQAAMRYLAPLVTSTPLSPTALARQQGVKLQPGIRHQARSTPPPATRTHSRR